MPSRGTKFYRKNEEEVMKAIGLNPTKNSGAGWIEKEDGQNDYLICQLKSTDARSISVKQEDIRILEKNARVSHKIPIFAIQFLNTGEVWLMAKPEDFSSVSEYIETGKCNAGVDLGLDISAKEVTVVQRKDAKTIKSCSDAREQYNRELQDKKEKENKQWKKRLR